MIHLPEVTLLIYNPDKNPNISARVLNYICESISFGAVKHLTSSPPKIPCVGEYIYVPNNSWEEGQRMQAYGLNEYFDTPFLLHVETDGFPVNPHLWKDEFLKYDYIGAPWPAWIAMNNRVGNGGCSLQSKKFRQFLWDNKDKYVSKVPSDVWFCQYMYEEMMGHIKFAPLHIAMEFSLELIIEEYPYWDWTRSFAFHGKYPHLNTPRNLINKYI